MEKKKIVFVDDEPNILDGLRRMLRSLRSEYDMYFASGGREALELLAKDRFDVVISDMRMPGMDGAQLLETIQKEHPHTIRIMLSGQADEASILRTVGVAHQFLAKPCDPERLKAILVQTSAVQDMLSDGRLKDLISQVGTLPTLPIVYAKLQKAIVSSEVDIAEVAELIEQDIALSAKVMQLVNSAFFGIYVKVESPGRAVKLLGLETIKSLVLCIEIFSENKISEEIFQINMLWPHSLAVGKVAKAIAAHETDDKDIISNAFLAGILHDIGKLVLISQLPEQYKQVINLAREQGVRLSEAEQTIYGASQSAIGAYLAGLWGFTSPIIEAIGFHHSLEKYPASSFTPALAVHVANALYYRNRPNEIIGRVQDLHMSMIERLALQDRVKDWERICAEILHAEEAGEPL
ncbi:MAG: HDOD domain-containing protein [Proteobacteria bacterium]|nr:HDOD domain-containing protein [Pseudomonadota bacterium]